jgi:hypothetical protein
MPSYIYSLISMATRAKYNRVKAPEENTNETKLDTDILMRFNDSYGTHHLTQVATSAAHSRSSSERANPS